MPETRFDIVWPDHSTQTCWSPSTVIHDYLKADQHYPVADFVELADTALTAASERVRAKYGYACTAAAEQIERIRSAGIDQGAGDVLVVRIHP